MILEDEFGDDVEVEFHADGTAEFAVLTETAQYRGGFVLRPEEGKRLHRRMAKWLAEVRGEEFDGEVES